MNYQDENTTDPACPDAAIPEAVAAEAVDSPRGDPVDSPRGETVKPRTKRQIEDEAKAARAADRAAAKIVRDAEKAAEAARIAADKAEWKARKAAEEAAKPRPVVVIDKDAQVKTFFNFFTSGRPAPARLELRAIRWAGKKNEIKVAYYDDWESLAAGVRAANKEGYNCYANLNPFDPAEPCFAARSNLVASSALKNADVVKRLFLLIDGDPDRYENGLIHPKKGAVCTTDAEHDKAHAMIKEVYDFLIQKGVPLEALIMNDSGNGASILAAIDLPNTEEVSTLIEKFLLALNQKFHTDFCHVDDSVHDAARVTRIPGSVNCKAHAKDRPQRPCYTLTPERQSVVDGVRAILPLSLLNEVAGTAIEPKEGERDPSVEFHSIPEGERKEQLALVVAYLEDNGIKHRGFSRNEAQHFFAVELPYCLIKGAEHQTPGRAAVLVMDDGRLGYKCFSEGCNKKGWPVMQKAMKEGFADFCARAYNKTGLKFDDPLRFAKEYLKQTSTPEGLPTIAHFQNTTHRHNNGYWQPIEKGEDNAWVRALIQAEHFRLAEHLSKIGGEEVKPEPVNTLKVNETVNTVQSLCRYEISKDATTPFWLKPYQDWLADDILVYKNGFFNVRKWVENQDKPELWFKPITPDLYYAYQGDFEFPLYAASTGETLEAPVWFHFLDSLGQSEAWRRQLRQMIGYLLWSGYDLHKFFHLFGPTRAGKGIVEKVCQELGGGYEDMRLDAFAEQFALEKAIGKRLLVISETEDGPSKALMSNVVRAIKALTGGSNKTEVNRKHIKNISVRLNCKLLASGQKRLRLSDSSSAVIARCIPLRYTISWLNKEDTELPDKLRKEYPAILLWALEGLRDLRQTCNGQFALCETTLKLLDEMHATNNALQTFVEECCDIDATKAVWKPALFSIYEQWYEIEADESLERLDDKQFGTELPVLVATVSDGRLTHDTDKEYTDTHTRETFDVVPTAFDAKGPKRPRIYTGICPKPEWRQVHLNL